MVLLAEGFELRLLLENLIQLLDSSVGGVGLLVLNEFFDGVAVTVTHLLAVHVAIVPEVLNVSKQVMILVLVLYVDLQ